MKNIRKLVQIAQLIQIGLTPVILAMIVFMLVWISHDIQSLLSKVSAIERQQKTQNANNASQNANDDSQIIKSFHGK